MRVLVTGGGGFIGNHLVRAQLKLGRQVRALDIDTSRLDDLSGDENLEVVLGSITDSDVIESAAKDVDIVFHLASAHLEVNLPEDVYWKTNVRALEGFLGSCHQAGVKRFVHVSSVGVYGKMGGVTVNEESACSPEILYERTKLAGEKVVKEFSSETGFPVVIVRPSWVYGPGCHRTEKLLRGIRKGRFVMVGNGDTTRYAVYVDDLVKGMELCASVDSAVGATFILSNHEPVSVRSLTDSAAKAMDVSPPRLQVPLWLMRIAAMGIEAGFAVIRKQPPVSRRTLLFFTNDMALDTSKSRDQLGFKPKTTIAEGMTLSYNWLRERQLV